MPAIRVAIGDDDRAFREAVIFVLTADSRFSVVASVGSGGELRHAAAELHPDLALVDIRMPGGGPEAVLALVQDARDQHDRRLRPLVVVAVSARTGVDDVRAMVLAGATGYLAKDQLGGDLPDLVHRCAKGEVVLAVPTGARALRQLTRPDGGPGSGQGPG